MSGQGQVLTWHTASLVGKTEKKNKMFQCNKITQKVSSQLV